MAKPNWKQRGLPRYISPTEMEKRRKREAFERRLLTVPPELRSAARQNPGLLGGF